MRGRTVCAILWMALAPIGCPAQQSNRVEQQLRYNHLPLTFEANVGQSDPKVKFLSRAKGYTAFLTANGIVLTFRPEEVVKTEADLSSSSIPRKRQSRSAVELGLVGADRNVTATGEDPLPGRVNYFIGNDPSKWHTNVRTFRRVRYSNLYPGIDLIYYGNHRQLEYDFVIAPHADAERVQFEIKGAGQIELGSEGNLIVKMGNGELHFRRPAVYQESNGLHIPLDGEYVMKSPTRVAFHVPNYDPNKPLIIDPVLAYSTYLGGTGDDQPTGIAVDSEGSVYISGYTDSTDFPLATLGSLPPGSDHVFVAKFDASGSNLVYADYIGGNSQDYGYALALDGANEVYVAGSTASSDFPTVNPYQGTYPGSFNAFLTKISSDGSSLLYSTYLGGNGSDVPSRVAIDSSSNAIVAGTTSSTNFPVINAYQATASPNQGGVYGSYGFVTKFSQDGSSLAYSTYLGGSANVSYTCGTLQCWPSPSSTLTGMVLDQAGNAYMAGTTNTYDFPVTTGTYLTTNSTKQNSSVGFVSKIGPSGTLQYSTYFYESSGFTNITAIAVDNSSSPYVTGLAFSDGTFPITSTTICDPGVYATDCSYAFVTKFDATASTLAYSTFLGPYNYAVPAAILLDQSNDAYILAATSSSSFGEVNGIEPYAGGNDLLLVEIDPLASTQLFATYLGGSLDESATGMVLDAAGNVYLAGTTTSTNLPTTQAAFQSTPGGNSDGFVMKIATIPAPMLSLTPSTLTFTLQAVGSTSPAQQVVLQNMGSAALTISSIAKTGDFAETDDCGSSVVAGGSCTLSVTFTPTVAGQRTGAITITDNAAGSPHALSLNGNGAAAIAALAPASLAFSAVPIGSSSAAQMVTLSNQGNSSLNINSAQITGDFAQTNNCPASLAAGSSCIFSVTFTPIVSGNRAGALTISDNATGSPQSVALSGNGSDFSLAGSPTSTTLKAGGTATFTLTVTPLGGAFSNQVQLNCTGAPANSTCSLSPTSVEPESSTASVNLTIVTTAASSEALPFLPRRNTHLYAFWMQLQGLSLFAVVVVGAARRRRKTLALLVLLLLVSGLLFMSACAGGTGVVSSGGKGTASGTYTITVSGTSGSLRHSVPLTLTVQ